MQRPSARSYFTIFSLYLIVVIFSTNVVVAENIVRGQGAEVTFNSVNKPLCEVLDLISEQTGYSVSIDEEFNSVLVLGEYDKVPIDRFFRRVLRKNNISVLVNEQQKKVMVRFFGKKGTGKYIVNSPAQMSAKSKREEIEIRHEKQYAELKAILDDPESVDPQSGMKLTEIWRKNKEQKEELERMKNNPNSVDPQSGMKLTKITEKNKQQQEELDSESKDPDVIVDADTGQTRADLQSRHKRQEDEFQEYINAYVDPVTGESVADIKAKNERQVKELAL